jgi:hypothetical protein
MERKEKRRKGIEGKGKRIFYQGAVHNCPQYVNSFTE